MRRDEAIELIRAHIEDLRRYHVRSLSLFGSVARDQADAKSDVDVLVEFAHDPTMDDYVGLTLFLEKLFGRHVDVLTQDSIKPRVRPQIERDLVHVA